MILQKALRGILRFPVETVASILAITGICYLLLIISSATPSLPLVSFSNGSLYSPSQYIGSGSKNPVLYLKKVIISLPKVHSVASLHGVISSQIIDSLTLLQKDIINSVDIVVQGGKKVSYQELCWTQGDGSCALFAPVEEMFSLYPKVNVIDAITHTLKEKEDLIRYGVDGLVVDKDQRVVRADSIIISLYFNYTTLNQQQLVQSWEKRLMAMRSELFYSPDLSLYFAKVLPDGKVVYDLFYSMEQLTFLFKVRAIFSFNHL
jgi:hypothetical protein